MPAVVGVPASTPAELRDSPGGSVPAFTDQAYGAVPPLAVSVSLYAAPTSAAGGAGNVADTPADTVILVASVALWPLASVTLTVKANVPVTVGVPVSVPLAFRLIPAGGLPLLTDQVNGLVPPDSVRVSP